RTSTRQRARTRPRTHLPNPTMNAGMRIGMNPRMNRRMRVGDKPLRRQSRSLQIAPRKPNTRNVKLANNPSRNRLKTRVQYIDPVIGQRTPNGDVQPTFVTGYSMADRIDRGFRRAIKIRAPSDLNVA